MNGMIIKLQNIQKKFSDGNGEEICPLNNLNMEINEGESIAIVGTSGAGKTTLLNILGLVEKADSGLYLFNGEDQSRWKDKELSRLRNQMFGYIMQDFALIEYRTVSANVSVPLLFNSKIKNKEKQQKVNDILKKIGIYDLRNKKVWELSGGQKQRVAVARALVNDTKIILADEPTGSLDYKNKEMVMELLKDLNEKGVTVVCVTHDMEVAKYCKKIYTLENGNLNLERTMDE